MQSDTLLLAGVFENFRNICIKVYELDPDQFSSASGLSWQACLKKTGVELYLITDPDMLLIVEEGIRYMEPNVTQYVDMQKQVINT